MSLVKWNPWREIEDLFDHYTGINLPRLSGKGALGKGDWCPSVDIAETEKSFIIKAEIPEVKKEDVKVTVNNGILTIEGERKEEKEEKEEKKFHRIERYYGKFSRSFTLPENARETEIKASFKDGMLTLEIEKTEEEKSKSIQVKVE
jgi:HSP20 family protein